MSQDSSTRLTGIITPLLTPFEESGLLDEDMFRRQVRHLLDVGVAGLSPAGSTGEGAAVETYELVRMLEIIEEENREGALVVPGIIRNSTQAASEVVDAIRHFDIDALMVTPTYYNVLVPDERGNAGFYRQLAEHSSLPIIIYNVVPQNVITPELASEMFTNGDIVGVKQSVGSIGAMYDMRQLLPKGALVYAATDEMLASCFSVGADGAISAILALFPEHCIAMWDAVQEGNSARALEIQRSLYPVWRIIQGPQFPARMKVAVRALGRDCGYPRRPLEAVPEDIQQALTEAVRKVVPI